MESGHLISRARGSCKKCSTYKPKLHYYKGLTTTPSTPCSSWTVCGFFNFLQSKQGLWDVIYRLSSLSEKTGKSNHLQMVQPRFQPTTFRTIVPCSTNWANQSAIKKQGKGAHEPKAHTVGVIPVSLARSTWEYYYSPLDGMLVHRRVTPSIISLVPIYTPEWREAVWSKVSCLRKQHSESTRAWTPHLLLGSSTR